MHPFPSLVFLLSNPRLTPGKVCGMSLPHWRDRRVEETGKTNTEKSSYMYAPTIWRLDACCCRSCISYWHYHRHHQSRRKSKEVRDSKHRLLVKCQTAKWGACRSEVRVAITCMSLRDQRCKSIAGVTANLTTMLPAASRKATSSHFYI